MLLLAACSSPPASPEEEIRQWVGMMEQAAEEKDLGVIREHIAEQYEDQEHRRKEDVENVLRYMFLRNRSIYLLTRVHRIDLESPTQADVIVFVAMAGTEIPDAGILPTIHADIYRVDATLEKRDDRWRVHSAAWEPATTEDLQS